MTTRPSAILEIQTAFHSRLTGDSTLMGLVTGIFDGAPEGQPPPYITYGDHVDGTMPTFGGHWNCQATIMLDLWSQSLDKAECYQILAEVNRLLVTTVNNPPLPLQHFGPANVVYEWSTTVYEDLFTLWHLSARYLVRAIEN
jgi:uncharacterized protein DUF3168